MKNICFQMNRKALLALISVVCLAFPALAQKITVSGTVYEPEGEPAIGASVMVQGVQGYGVSTDIDGNYRIEVAPDAVLVFSYVGYETQTVPVNGQTTIDVTLVTNSAVLDEVVVVGYGTVKKSDATGSVAVVKPDEIEAGLATSANDLLVGASPGVVVTTNGGNPTGGATIRIRGGASLSANNDPLIVIDGVPMNNQDMAGGTNALTMISPDNIESMTILKDASATAIYGSRASNGVIIIQTKRGKSGRPQVNFTANFHVANARKTLNLMNAAQFGSFVEEFGSDAAKGALYSPFLPEDEARAVSTDWQKEVLRTSFSHDYSLSVGGQAGFLPYRVSATYSNSEGIVNTSDMQRTTVGINLNPKFFNGLLQVNANVNGTYVNSREADLGAIGIASTFSPTLPVRTAYPTLNAAGESIAPIYQGYTNIFANGEPETNAIQNPVQLLDGQNNRGTVWSSTGNLQIDYALHCLPELHFNLNLGYQVSENRWKNDIQQNSIMAWRGNYKDGAGTHYEKYELQRNTLLDFYANYKKDFDAIKSNVDVMAGYSWQRFTYFGHSQTLINTLGYNMQYAGNSWTMSENPASESHIGHSYNDVPMDRWAGPNQLISFFGRLNYTFDDTYLLTFTLRDDASSRFSKDNRWGLFPSLALGWKIINMPFMEGTRSWWNDLKLRLGWGVTGQQDIGSLFPYMPVYSLSPAPFQYLDPTGTGKWIDILYPNAYDASIKWEETTTWNVGVDMSFLNNAITLAADWYLRKTKDLLAYTPVAGFNTSNYMNRNIGSLRNTGFEFTITARPISNRDFTWTTGLNVAYNENKITKLTGDAETSQIAARDVPGGTGGGLQYHMVGEPAYSYWVYEQVYDASGNPVEGQYVDQNADGKIDDSDKIIFHSPEPKWTMSWNNNFNYKGFDLGFTLRANFGNYVYNNHKYERTRPVNNLYGYQLNNLLNDSYLFTSVAPSPLSSYYVENASFLRCDNITLGYTWDNILYDGFRLRLYGAVQNPFVITKYKGLDPEVFSGIDNNCYPNPTTWTVGVVATF